MPKLNLEHQQIGDCLLIKADCMEAMNDMPSCLKVDALIWDPPWGIDFKEYESHKDCSDNYQLWINGALNKAETFVSDGWCVVFQGAKRAWEWNILIPREWRVMACAKNFIQILPGKGPLWATDYALFWPIGEPRVEHGRGRDYHVAITSNMKSRPKGHPCPRPLDQMQYVIDCFTETGMTALDPTMGSGTTGVACALSGRKFIGIEMEQKYFDIACERIEAAYKQTKLFIDHPAYEQEAMF